MGWLQFLLHPRRTARILAESRESAETMRGDNDSLRGRVAALETELHDMKMLLSDKDKEIERLRDECNEVEDMKAQMREIDKLLENMLQARKNYDERLERYRQKIRSLKEELREMQVGKKYGTIDMRQSSYEQERVVHKPTPRRSVVQSQIPFDEPEKPKKPAPSKPTPDFEIDDSDWLKTP